jgi:hypothetical protein
MPAPSGRGINPSETRTPGKPNHHRAALFTPDREAAGRPPSPDLAMS